MYRLIVVSLLIGLALIASIRVSAQTEKDVIGRWKLDLSRSNFSGGRTAPADIVIRFDADGSVLRETIRVVNAQGESTRIIRYAVDGSVTVNGSGDEQVKTRLLRNSGGVVLEWIDDGGTFTRTLRLSDDHRTLSIKAHDTNPDVQADDLIVLQRQ
jgi:hypothetical protein